MRLLSMDIMPTISAQELRRKSAHSHYLILLLGNYEF